MNRKSQLISPRGSGTPIRAWVGTIATASMLSLASGAIAQQYGGLISPSPTAIPVAKDDLVINFQRSLYMAKFTCGILDEGLRVSKTAAQVNKGLGAGPPLPPEHLTPPLLAQLVPPPYYHDFQPGSYSTALNLFNPTLRPVDVQVKISSDSLSGPITVATKSIGSLEAVRIGCSDIEGMLPSSFTGELIEGFFHVTRPRADLHAEAVYTYSSMGAFQEFRGGFVSKDGGVIPLGSTDYYVEVVAGAGAGAGGLGLGASVDIESIEPMMIDF
ncbi:MAG: hypothetical protein WBG92_12925 [Thiohalocapsa sp.]